MIDISRKNIFTKNQMQCLLLLGILQFMFMGQLNIFDNFFVQENSKHDNISVALQPKPIPPEAKVEKIDVFAYQIKKAEPLHPALKLTFCYSRTQP